MPKTRHPLESHESKGSGLFVLPAPPHDVTRHRSLESLKHLFEVDVRPAEDASPELCEPMILAEEVGVARF